MHCQERISEVIYYKHLVHEVLIFEFFHLKQFIRNQNGEGRAEIAADLRCIKNESNQGTLNIFRLNKH